jgi:hypothetical protein
MSHFDLQAILHGDASQLSDAFVSTAINEGKEPDDLRQHLASQVYRQLIGGPQLDAQLLPLFANIEVPLVAQIAQDDSFYINPDQALRRTLGSIIPAASHWFAGDAKPSKQFYERLSTLFQNLATHWHDQTDTSQELASFTQWLANEDKRAALLETRLCETERGNQKLAIAQTRVIKLINSNLALRPLPIEWHSTIANRLKSELQYWAFNTPSTELTALPLWVHWQRILPSLGQLFSHGDIQVDDQLLYHQIPALLTELERSLAQATSNTPAYQQLVDQLSRSLMAAVQKQPQDIGLFPALPMPEGQTNANTKVPLTLLQATEAVRVGDWILMRGDDQEHIRCKLALKNPDLDQLLFVDHTGRKVMNKTNKDFALCLSTGIAQPLRLMAVNDIIEAQLHSLIERANLGVNQQLRQQKQKAEALVRAFRAEQQTQAESAERERHAAQASMQAELDARQAAAHKAMTEARLLAHEQQRRTAEKAADQQRLMHEQEAVLAAETLAQKQTATNTLNELQVGAWLEINSTDIATRARAKLSVIISATGKYIFADQVGRKVAEYSREQLLDQFINGNIKVLRNGDNFEEQLAKVIRGLRRDVN